MVLASFLISIPLPNMQPVTTRPARRIPAARLAHLRAANAARLQAREEAFQSRQDALMQLANPMPEFAPAPRLTLLPGGLHWSNPAPVPAIGTTVTVNRAGHAERVEVYPSRSGMRVENMIVPG